MISGVPKESMIFPEVAMHKENIEKNWYFLCAVGSLLFAVYVSLSNRRKHILKGMTT